jgi:hypothetical protein
MLLMVMMRGIVSILIHLFMILKWWEILICKNESSLCFSSCVLKCFKLEHNIESLLWAFVFVNCYVPVVPKHQGTLIHGLVLFNL